MEAPYETVYVVEDWYDGPRSGYARYRQQPHAYRSLYLDWNSSEDYNPDEDRFELTPVSAQVLEWAVASHHLWLKWNTAYRTGTLPAGANDEERILPEDRAYDQELRALIEQFMNTQTETRFIVRGKFEPGCGKFEPGCDRVQWYEINA